MHNHTPLSCLGRGSVYPGVCVAFPVPPALARVHHYRRDCVASLVRSDSYNHYIVKYFISTQSTRCRSGDCSARHLATATRDTAVWRWRPLLVPRLEAVIAQLGLG